MRNLHCGGHFLRLLRSICAKTACARRAIVALFVATATILATFMIMPSASMGASSQNESNQEQTQSQAKSENPEPKTASSNEADAKGGAVVEDGASVKDGAKESNTDEPKNPQPSIKPDGSSASRAQNVDSTNQPNNDVEGANKNLNKDVIKKGVVNDVAKDAKKSELANKSRRQNRALVNTLAANGTQECQKAGSLAKCYKVKYEPHFSKDSDKKTVVSERGKEFYVEPTFKPLKGKSKKVNYEDFVTKFELEEFLNEKHKKTENNGPVTVDPTTGKITVYANKWMKESKYYAHVKVTYSDGSYTTNFDCPTGGTKCVKSVIRLSFSIASIDGTKGDLSLKVYNHQDSKGRSEVQDTDGVTFTSNENGSFSSITPIFIDTTSAKKPNPIYHRMICHKDDQRTGYTLNNVDGLKLRNTNDATLLDEDDGSVEGYTFQKQWDYALGDRPGEESAKDFTVYENDTFTERSQSWIVGTPTDVGDFTCKVFAFNDADFTPLKTSVGSYVNLFKSNTENLDDSKLQSIFEDPAMAFCTAAGAKDEFGNEDQCKASLSKQKTIDWDYKTIKIVFKSKKKKQLEVKDGDLKLNVYPFKSNDAGSGSAAGGASAAAPSALGNNSTVSVMKGMELKPFIEATSEADSQKEINLKILCSKGEKPKESDASDAGGSGTKSIQSNTDLKYTKWVDPSRLGFNFPDNSQIKCTSSEGEQSCIPDGATTKFAARTYASAMFKSTEAGDYKCVVYALKKPDALNKFNDEATKTDVTPEKISTSFKGANLTANKDFAQLAFKIHVPEDFTLPHTGGQNWNLQLGAIAAVMVSVLAVGFVASQSEACRKLLYERRRC